LCAGLFLLLTAGFRSLLLTLCFFCLLLASYHLGLTALLSASLFL
jgi:hypothetical protein